VRCDYIAWSGKELVIFNLVKSPRHGVVRFLLEKSWEGSEGGVAGGMEERKRDGVW